ncbi:MAG: hypothetical protein IPJ26_17475 [Bacteroidetes bacterium]|nr:hypothetical protein [Bacteroidota bacterium]
MIEVGGPFYKAVMVLFPGLGMNGAKETSKEEPVRRFPVHAYEIGGPPFRTYLLIGPLNGSDPLFLTLLLTFVEVP